MINWIRKLFKPKSRQTCWVYCKRCRYELTASKRHQSCWHDQDGFVWYCCEQCGMRSQFDFDMPAPGLYFVDDFTTWMHMMDERIAAWHRSDGTWDLHKYLGLSQKQYQSFVEDPKSFFTSLLDKHRSALYG